jgi:hypothetical protein
MSFRRVWIRSRRVAIEILTANVVTLNSPGFDSIIIRHNGIRAAEEAVLNKLHKNYPPLAVKLKKDVVYRKEVCQD